VIEMKNGLIIDKNGTKCWFLNDKLHRENGPAVVTSGGVKLWYINGKLHREDGHALEYTSTGYKEWYYHDKRIDCFSQEDFERLIKVKVFW